MYLKQWNFSNLKLLKYLTAFKIFICTRNIYLLIHNIRETLHMKVRTKERQRQIKLASKHMLYEIVAWWVKVL